VPFKPVLAVGLAVVGLYLAGTLSGVPEDELAPPKMSGHDLRPNRVRDMDRGLA
jgi:hypothetical protein